MAAARVVACHATMNGWTCVRFGCQLDKNCATGMTVSSWSHRRSSLVATNHTIHGRSRLRGHWWRAFLLLRIDSYVLSPQTLFDLRGDEGQLISVTPHRLIGSDDPCRWRNVCWLSGQFGWAFGESNTNRWVIRNNSSHSSVSHQEVDSCVVQSILVEL
jgi:hypothetical protein